MCMPGGKIGKTKTMIWEFIGFDENKFIEKLTKRDFEVAAYERESMEKLPELLKTTLRMTKTSGAMCRYLFMDISGMAIYQQAKATMFNYCKTSSLSASAQSHATLNSRTTDNRSTPMEIDADHRGNETGQEKEEED